MRENGFEVEYCHCPTRRLDCSATEAVINAARPFAIVIMKEHINAGAADAVSAAAKKAGAFVIWCGPFVTALMRAK